MLPPALSPRWLVVLLVTAALWTGLAMLAAYLNTGQPPTLETLRGASLSLLLIAGPPALLGFLGARMGFLFAQIGLLIGYLLLLRAFAGPNTGGFEDLAAVATFLMLGAIGLGLGTVLDIGRWFVGKRRP
ncbi:hypothetical protein SAMN02745121_01292 [Nannocystis exedens]|uniref:Uncharacterized protein n=1 Tax=Nannocystis exedens TaxID=54 RepID=A0A1I1UTQ7_9BACT|nr:hypothetical protein [Nannocystis exedens]PCC72083.1 hypothetical protein NAEX_05162 [Nannocystis exedens]SFD74049.1 hypothetical protein SAMN02745121_01292 [Nannocystis exedens]